MPVSHTLTDAPVEGPEPFEILRRASTEIDLADDDRTCTGFTTQVGQKYSALLVA